MFEQAQNNVDPAKAAKQKLKNHTPGARIYVEGNSTETGQNGRSSGQKGYPTTPQKSSMIGLGAEYLFQPYADKLVVDIFQRDEPNSSATFVVGCRSVAKRCLAAAETEENARFVIIAVLHVSRP